LWLGTGICADDQPHSPISSFCLTLGFALGTDAGRHSSGVAGCVAKLKHAGAQ
jgi:hypothetical protein